ncbi:MAG: C39 family peptidase [Deltaproteobacteria bacterium]|nr:C39 family peptidase [Deltaproteobacteria bacterium]
MIFPALADDFATGKIPLNPYGIRSPNPYVVNRVIEDGNLIDEVIVPGRPSPPEGFNDQVAWVLESNVAAGTNIIANVPALTWVFGCSATSAAMMFGHYDNAGYPNMYAGPTNGGVFPMTNAVWGTVAINGETRALCPLSATRLGLDNRTVNGHVDDYWINTGDPGPDPFIGNWAEHPHGECTADFMGTNQSSFDNEDGFTRFWFYPNGAPLYDYTASEPAKRDGCHGLRLFVESRGYAVQASGNFSQYIYGYNGNTQGYAFADYKAEIDAGRPVMLHLEGHTVLGHGYDDVTSTVFFHDTWDYSDHAMTWGGVYLGMPHFGVSVLRLAPIAPVPPAAPALMLSVYGTTVVGLWNSVPEAAGYIVSYAPYPYTGPETIGSFDMGTQTWFSVELWRGAAFYVAVQAYNSAGRSDYSNLLYFIMN